MGFHVRYTIGMLVKHGRTDLRDCIEQLLMYQRCIFLRYQLEENSDSYILGAVLREFGPLMKFDMLKASVVVSSALILDWFGPPVDASSLHSWIDYGDSVTMQARNRLLEYGSNGLPIRSLVDLLSDPREKLLLSGN